MNNSTRNFSNSSNAQNSSSFKDKLRKLTTGVALAGTLLMGTACENKTNTTADEKKEKIENVEVKADNQDSELSDIDFDKAAAELNYEFRDMQIKADSIANLEDAKRIAEEGRQIAEEGRQIAEEGRQIAEEGRQIREKREKTWRDVEKELAGVTKEMLEGSQKLQKIVIRHIEQGKKYWYQPSQHTLDLMISINK